MKKPGITGVLGYNRSRAGRCTTTSRPLTHSLVLARKGLPIMVPKTCTIPECGNQHKARGLCGKHYQRWVRGDDSLGLPTPELIECDASGCTAKSTVAEFCSIHYQRNRRHGNPLGGGIAKMRDVDAKFKARTVREGECLVWTAGQKSSGYGKIFADGRGQTAHVWAYKRFVGPVPEGMEVDHRCWNRLCCEPTHLRLVTHKQNNENHQGALVTSTTGFRGVHWNTKAGKYQVEVKHNQKKYYGGRFDDPEEANVAAIELRNELFTHNDIDRMAA